MAGDSHVIPKPYFPEILKNYHKKCPSLLQPCLALNRLKQFMSQGKSYTINAKKLLARQLPRMKPQLDAYLWIIKFLASLRPIYSTIPDNYQEITHFHILTHISLASFLLVHRQTVQTQIRRHIKWRLIRVSTVSLQNVQSKFE